MSSTSSQDDVAAVAAGQPGLDEPGHVDCVIIVVSYNSARHIGRLLDSLPAATSGLSARCLVVDNDSPDETMLLVAGRDDAAGVQVGRNSGYAGAINVGRALAGPCSSLLILNPDLELAPGSVRALYAALQQPGVGIAVPMLRDTRGGLYQSLRREPSLTRALGEALLGARLPGRPGWLSETVREPGAYRRGHDVAWAGGAALLISSACDQAVGPWDDQRFFLYCEETDYAARARRHGYLIRYVPDAQASHEDGGSGRSAALGALMAVNRVRYYEKYHGRPASWLFRAVVIVHYLLRSAGPEPRLALRYLLRRSSWAGLPGGAQP